MASLTYMNQRGEVEAGLDLPAPIAPAVERSDESDVSPIRQLFNTLWRRKWIIVACLFVAFVGSVLYVQQLTKRYVAEAVVVLESRRENVVNIQSVLTGGDPNFYTNETEAQVLRSRTLAAKVVDQLDLVNNPEFNPTLIPPSTGPVASLIKALNPKEFIKAIVPDAEDELSQRADERRRRMESSSPEQRDAMTRDMVIDYFLASLTVTATERSRALRLSFVSADAELAALAVNTLADIYILDSVNVKIETTRRASDWLNDRVSELKKRTKESQEALEAYRRKIGVIDLGQRATLMTQQLAELSTKLITARSERNEAEAKFAQLRKLLSSPDGIETASAVLANQLIQRLREQEAQLLREMAELKITLRDQHPRMINKQGELADLQQKIRREIEKIGTSEQSALEIVKAREANLQAEVNLLQKQLQEQSEAEVGLRQLESEVNANKQLLDTVLSRFKELDVQEQGLQTADARLISPATVPLRPAYPKKTLIIGFALVLAAVAGVALVFLLEHLDAGFRSLRQLEVASGVPSIGMVPLVTGRNVRPQDEVVERPQSVFAEAIRAVRTALLLSNVDRPPKTVLFTSSVPSEGKTSTAMALARASAKAGQRVIIIDCDVRSPAVHTALGVPNLNGVVDVLSGESKLEDVIDIDERSGCHYVTAGRMAPNPTDLLGSARMRQMLDRLREVYDLVVIDTPPVLAVSDTLVLLRLADKTCFVVRWGKTHREAAVNALRQVIDAGADLLGALLTQVDAKKHAQYHYGNSAYYYGAYRKYYGNR